MCEAFFYTPKNELGVTPFFKKLDQKFFRNFLKTPLNPRTIADKRLFFCELHKETLCAPGYASRFWTLASKRSVFRMAYPLWVENVVFPWVVDVFIGSPSSKNFSGKFLGIFHVGLPLSKLLSILGVW